MGRLQGWAVYRLQPSFCFHCDRVAWPWHMRSRQHRRTAAANARMRAAVQSYIDRERRWVDRP